MIFMALALLSIVACQKEETPQNNTNNPAAGAERPYVIASQGTFSNTTTNALLTAASLDGGTIGIVVVLVIVPDHTHNQIVVIQERVNDGVDNDHNGLFDKEDPACK